MNTSQLISAAREAREKAYAPYSLYAVGAALLTGTGLVFTGANVENASFGLTVCAERVAVFSAVSAGHRSFRSLAVIADGPALPLPCGACLQVLWEMAGDIEFTAANLEGEQLRISLAELLPHPFTFQNQRE